MVPTANLIIMAVNALLGFAIPVFLCWWAVKKHQAKLSTILIGAGTFVVFALVLESIVHQIVLKGPSGAVIQGKTLYYALYGGLPGVSYGLGHGGVEMAIIFGLSMISTLTMAIMVNLGQTDTLLSSAPAEAKDQLTATFEQLQTTGAGTYLLGLWERFSAITLHVGLSILVWAAVRKGGKWLWLCPAAILLHALVDGLAVILSKSAGMVTVELIIMALAIAVAALAWLVARRAFPKEEALV